MSSLETMTGSVLEFTSETVLFAELPTLTEPKSTEVGAAVKLPIEAAPPPAAVT
jgi:hypothetical protein